MLLSITFVNSQNHSKMKLNAGVVTKKLQESKEFYTKYLDFKIVFENEFYVLLSTPDGSTELSFLEENHPSQQPLFQKAFNSSGIYLTIELSNVDEWYKRLHEAGVKIQIDIRDEPWGDRHFAITDPNGVHIDLVRYTAPE